MPNFEDTLKEDVTQSPNATPSTTSPHAATPTNVAQPDAQRQKLLTLWLIALIGPAAALWV